MHRRSLRRHNVIFTSLLHCRQSLQCRIAFGEPIWRTCSNPESSPADCRRFTAGIAFMTGTVLKARRGVHIAHRQHWCREAARLGCDRSPCMHLARPCVKRNGGRRRRQLYSSQSRMFLGVADPHNTSCASPPMWSSEQSCPTSAIGHCYHELPPPRSDHPPHRSQGLQGICPFPSGFCRETRLKYETECRRAVMMLMRADSQVGCTQW